MPELPEVETIRRQLDQSLRGLKITQIEIISKKNFQGQPKEIIGRIVKEVSRRAKIILMKLDNGQTLAIHLKLTGQLIYRDKESNRKKSQITEKEKNPFSVKELPNKFTTVVITFADKSRLFFNDLRKFGWMRIFARDEEWGEKKLGPEADDGVQFTQDYFQKILAKSRKPIKLVIMDQEKIAGVGNIYANEALFRAGILPSRPANSLKAAEEEKLREAILGVLKDAINKKGTSDTDEAYRQISGEKGNFQNFLKVYGRAGEQCSHCRGAIKRMKIGGRGTFYCPVCQK